MIELLPAKATFAPGEPIEIELRGEHGPLALALWHLDRLVAEVERRARRVPRRVPAAAGGRLRRRVRGCAHRGRRLADPLSRARYGFVSDYSAGREVGGVADNVRRLHLNAIQFYDWMYRHARAASARPTSSSTRSDGSCRSTASAASPPRSSGAGSLPLGYAAVYAAGGNEWPEWEADGLYRATASRGRSAIFLWNVDPTSARWQAHFAADLRSASPRSASPASTSTSTARPKRALRATEPRSTSRLRSRR